MVTERPPTLMPEGLELIQGDIRLTSLVFGINLYTHRSFYDEAAGLLSTWDLFLARCPPERLTFHATETMKAHKPVTKRVLGLLGAWLAPTTPRKNYLALELKASQGPEEAPVAKYEIWNVDASNQANILSLALPAGAAQETPGEMLAFVRQLADVFPFRSGLAGFTFECSRYDKQASETHAWDMSMRHPGINIVRIPFDAKAAGGDGIPGVNWLTMIDSERLKQLGGAMVLRRQLPSDIELIECRHGTLIQAGPRPLFGDVSQGDTLPLYREVHRLLAPWIEIAAEQSMALRIGKDAIARTDAWYRRLGG
ncbi:DUF3396 domain-containing protein [Myxococcus sp. AM011]|uniref:type VI immunity family protein n=1 Tax=Myxococcus sp. AM011 TaxID=2745200 RepID=UPI001594E9C7|nr:type VI immunity family protein [Myxococcus sp. AM011]NVJ21601.1 DUF3396 domain-containing protein [Myxococcus sp. AM011]